MNDATSSSLYDLTVRWRLDGPADARALPDADEAAADIVVEHGDVPASLSSAERRRGAWQVAPSEALLTIAGLVRVLVSDGRRMRCELLPSAEPDDVPSIVGTMALPMLLHQRGLLLLRGTAVVTPQGVVVIGASACAGASTMAAILMREGATLLSDDLVVLDVDEALGVTARAGPPFIRLHRTTAEALGYRLADGRPLRRGEVGGLRFPVPEPPAPPHRVRAVVLVREDDPSRGGRVDGLPPPAACATLCSRSPLLGLLSQAARGRALHGFATVTSQIPVLELQRVRHGPFATARALTDALA